MSGGIYNISRSESEWIDSPIGNFDGTDKLRVYRWFKSTCKIGIDNFGLYTGPIATIDKELLIGKVIVGQGDEQTPGFFNTVTCDAPEYHVLLYTFSCTFTVGHSIAGTAVQQSVVTTGRTGCEIESFN